MGDSPQLHGQALASEPAFPNADACSWARWVDAPPLAPIHVRPPVRAAAPKRASAINHPAAADGSGLRTLSEYPAVG
jgi:hypothetical protein